MFIKTWCIQFVFKMSLAMFEPNLRFCIKSILVTLVTLWMLCVCGSHGNACVCLSWFCLLPVWLVVRTGLQRVPPLCEIDIRWSWRLEQYHIQSSLSEGQLTLTQTTPRPPHRTIHSCQHFPLNMPPSVYPTYLQLFSFPFSKLSNKWSCTASLICF